MNRTLQSLTRPIVIFSLEDYIYSELTLLTFYDKKKTLLTFDDVALKNYFRQNPSLSLYPIVIFSI